MGLNKNFFIFFLKRLGVKFTAHYAEKLYNEHPNRYDLFGLSNLLSHYNIPNKSFLLENKSDLISIHPPYIVYIGGEFAIVISIDAQKVVYYSNDKIISLHTNKFIDICSGIVLLAKLSNESKEPDYKLNLKREILENLFTSFMLIGFVFTFFLLCIHSNVYSNFFMSISLGINFLGLFLTFLLLLSHLNVKTQLANRICSIFKHSDCNNILELDVASFLGISWSEYGFSYFLGNSLLILLFPEYILWASLVNIVVLPYSFWSIWYQAFRVKQWCVLCLIVQVILWGIFITNLIFEMILFPDIHIMTGVVVALLYGMPLIIVHKITKLLLGLISTTNLKHTLNRFKSNRKVFLTLLSERTCYVIPSTVSSISFGNSHSNIQLTILTNPHCSPCAKMHKRIMELLKKNSNIYVQYIFTSFSSELEISARFLIAVHSQYKPSIRNKIFEEWFERGRYDKEAFFAKYPVDFNNKFIVEELQRHVYWMESTRLSYTPCILINGHEFPDGYVVEDLAYIPNL